MMKKVLLWIAGISVVCLLVLGTYLYLNGDSLAEDIFKNKLIKAYNSDPKTKYFIDLEKVKFNIFDGSVDLIGISVSPKDSLVTFKKSLENIAYSNTSLKIYIERISLKNFEYQEAISNRKIKVDEFKIYQPEIRIYKHLDIPKPEKNTQDTVDFKSIFLVSFDTFLIQEVAIEDAYTAFFEISGQQDTNEIFSISNLNYSIIGLQADEKSLEKAPFISYTSYHLLSEKLKIEFKNSGELAVKNISFSSTTNELEIDGVIFKPDRSFQKFAANLRYRKPYINFALKKLRIEGINLQEWLDKSIFKSTHIEITEPKLVLHSDLRIPLDSTLEKKMLGSLLKDIPITYSVDSVNIENALIELQLTGKNGGKPGIIQFNSMNVQSGPISNWEKQLDKNPNWNIYAQTQVNKTGTVNAFITIDMTNERSTTVYNVEAKNLNLTNFNSVLEPIVHVDIQSGKIINLKVSSVLTSDGGYGTLDAHYEHLSVLLVSKKEHKHNPFFLNIASGIGNGILRNNNIPGSPNYHKGEFSFDKQPYDNFFKMVWLTTLYGLEDTLLGGSVRKEKRKLERLKKKEEHKMEKRTHHRNTH
jgi:hypothetical protein